MKSLASIFVVLFSIMIAATIVSCDSKPSTANSYASEDVYEEESQKTFQCTLCSGYGVYAGYTCNKCGGTGEIVADYVETRSNSDVSFRGRSFYYGRCNSGCGCQIYEHKPGQTECVNCAANGCSTTKLYHKKEYWYIWAMKNFVAILVSSKLMQCWVKQNRILWWRIGAYIWWCCCSLQVALNNR